jgi:shikimate 5-dehydrogenase
MHHAAFAQDFMEADAAEYLYVAMEVQPDRLSAAVRRLVALGFVGFVGSNVTMPHKDTAAHGRAGHVSEASLVP